MDQTFEVTMHHSGKKMLAGLQELVHASCSFLEYYGTHSLVGADFVQLIGEGSGKNRFSRLLAACDCKGEPEVFFQQLLPLLAEARQERVEIGGILLPYLYLVSILEVLLPGRGFITIRDVDQLRQECHLEVPESSRSALQKVIEKYPVRISYHTIRQMMVSTDVAYQYMPFIEELDPVGHQNTWVGQFHQGLLEQMYQNRVIFLLNMTCPVYCRFCFRKHKESRNEDNPSVEDVRAAIAHVGTSPTIKEIIITGGDPFLSRRNMAATIDGLMEIEHVQTLRLATRSVAYYPNLFLNDDGDYLKYLQQKNLELQRRGKRMEVATHFIHPDEISPESLGLITDLVNSGITVYVQTPFLKGSNDQGPVLQRLFNLLRGAGAEMHYIYIPCSPIHGNSVYWSPLSEGIDIAEYLRAHLSDRSIPKICTATPIGKMEWYTSGWAVEPVEGKEDFIWIRTPYTPEYFKSFAPVANNLPNIRVNAEGTLDIQYMASMGNDSYFLGSRELRITQTPIPLQLPESLSVRHSAHLLRGPSIVTTGIEGLRRVHETRVEIDTEAGERQFDYIRSDALITDVVVVSSETLPASLHNISRIADMLRTIPHVNAFRLRSPSFSYAPEEFTPTVVRRLGEINHLTAASPLRLEIESWFLTSKEVLPEHAKVVRALNNFGITVYSNVALLGGINDSPDEMFHLTFLLRQAGIEFHHLYVAGLPLQKEWSSEHPIDMYDVIDIASKIRREGSGREGPRYIIQTPIGEVYYGLTSSFYPEEKRVLMKLDSYNINYYQEIDPDFTLPDGIWENERGELIMPVPGLTNSTDFRI